MSKSDFGAICVGICMWAAIVCIGVPSQDPESPQSKCDSKGGLWYTPRKAENICIDRKMIINLEG